MDNISNILKELADKLGIAVEYLFSAIVKQQVIEGISSIVVSIFCFIIFILCIKIMPKKCKKHHDIYTKLREERIKNFEYEISSIDEDHHFFMFYLITVSMIIVLIITLLIGISGVLNGIKNIINPDYYAIKEILDMIGR